MKTLCFVLVSVLALGLFAPLAKADAGTIVLEGGVNTVETWYGAHENDSLNIQTDYPYDVVGTVYIDPAAAEEVDIRIYALEDSLPSLSRGTLIELAKYVDGYWEFRINPDVNGVSEAFIHQNVSSFPGNYVRVSAKALSQADWHNWEANISNGLLLQGGINTGDGWIGAQEGDTLNIVTQYAYDIVATTYTSKTDPKEVDIRIYALSDSIPTLSRGTPIEPAKYLDGFWEFRLNPDDQGVGEAVVHQNVTSISGKQVVVEAKLVSRITLHTWKADVSNGLVVIFSSYLPLIIK